MPHQQSLLAATSSLLITHTGNRTPGSMHLVCAALTGPPPQAAHPHTSTAPATLPTSPLTAVPRCHKLLTPHAAPTPDPTLNPPAALQLFSKAGALATQLWDRLVEAERLPGQHPRLRTSNPLVQGSAREPQRLSVWLEHQGTRLTAQQQALCRQPSCLGDVVQRLELQVLSPLPVDPQKGVEGPGQLLLGLHARHQVHRS